MAGRPGEPAGVRFAPKTRRLRCPQPPPSPKVEGKGPIIRRFDDVDVPFQAVRAQRNADGSESYVREKWFAFSAEPQYLSLYATYDPGMVVRRHGHFSPHIVFVIEGELWVGDEQLPRGHAHRAAARRRVRAARRRATRAACCSR